MWNVACSGARRVAFRVVVEKPEGKREVDDLGVDGRNIKIDIQKVG